MNSLILNFDTYWELLYDSLKEESVSFTQVYIDSIEIDHAFSYDFNDKVFNLFLEFSNLSDITENSNHTLIFTIDFVDEDKVYEILNPTIELNLDLNKLIICSKNEYFNEEMKECQ